MHPLQIRLSDEDRADLKQEAEWLPLHAGLFVKVRASRLEALEQQLGGVKLMNLLADDVDVKDIKFPRQLAWLARQLAGLSEPAFADFDPLTLAMEVKALDLAPEGGDVDPPASSSADTSAETRSPAKAGPSRSRRGSGS
jgi:hypothetical protein